MTDDKVKQIRDISDCMNKGDHDKFVTCDDHNQRHICTYLEINQTFPNCVYCIKEPVQFKGTDFYECNRTAWDNLEVEK